MTPIPLEEPTKQEETQMKDNLINCQFTKQLSETEDFNERAKKEREEMLHKRMNDINTFQAHENEVYLRGTDEYGNDFQICFDSYNFLEWIDTDHLEYIKEQLIKYIKTK